MKQRNNEPLFEKPTNKQTNKTIEESRKNWKIALEKKQASV